MESDLVKEGKAGLRKRGKSVSKREAKQIKNLEQLQQIVVCLFLANITTRL